MRALDRSDMHARTCKSTVRALSGPCWQEAEERTILVWTLGRRCRSAVASRCARAFAIAEAALTEAEYRRSAACRRGASVSAGGVVLLPRRPLAAAAPHRRRLLNGREAVALDGNQTTTVAEAGRLVDGVHDDAGGKVELGRFSPMPVMTQTVSTMLHPLCPIPHLDDE